LKSIKSNKVFSLLIAVLLFAGLSATVLTACGVKETGTQTEMQLVDVKDIPHATNGNERAGETKMTDSATMPAGIENGSSSEASQQGADTASGKTIQDEGKTEDVSVSGETTDAFGTGSASEVREAEQSVPAVQPGETGSTKEESNTEEKTESAGDTSTCHVIVTCHNAVANLSNFDEEIQEFIPRSGVILDEPSLEFTSGESCFDVLKRAADKNGVYLDYDGANAFGTIYVRGIGELYEFDGGVESGWMYNVNGAYPNVGSSAVTVYPGDCIEFAYTVTRGDL
jgi:hypothetical protein